MYQVGGEAHLRQLATWPGDRQEYAALLRDELLKHHKRLVLESMVLCYGLHHPDDPALKLAHDEAQVKLWADGKLVTTVIAYGPNSWAAKAEAELLALRQAALGDAQVPLLGRMMARGRLSLYIELENDRYWAVLRNDLGEYTWLAPPRLTQAEYRMPVRIKHDQERRTSYLIAMDIPDEVKEMLDEFMDVGNSAYVHRMVVALSGRYISKLNALAPVRASLELRGYKGQLREVHHVNGSGLFNIESNVQPFERHVHNAIHGVTPDGFMLGLFSGTRPLPEQGEPLLWLPVPTLITPYGVLGQQGHESLFPPIPGNTMPEHAVDGKSQEALGPPSWSRPPRPVMRRDITKIAHDARHEESLRRALAALTEMGGQGMLRNLKSSKGAGGMSANTLRNALRLLASEGIVGQARLGGGELDVERSRPGVDDHYRLLRPLSRSFFSVTKPKSPTGTASQSNDKLT